jgi:Flp pilus assembly protein TadD
MRLTEETSLMFMIRAVVLPTCVLFLSACGGHKDEVQYDKGLYQQVLDRQQAGLPVEAEDVAKSAPLTAADHERLGDSSLQQNNLALAQVHYSKALELDNKVNDMRYKLGLVLLKQGLSQEAYGQFQEILKQNDTSALAHEGMGQAHLQGGNEAAAEEEFRQALVLDPKLWKTHNFLGIISDHKKRHGAAIAEYQAALALKPGEPAVLNNLGLAYYLTGKYEDAVRAYQQAAMTGSTQPKIHNNLGMAYARLERYHDALDAFTKGSDQAQAYNNLGTIFLDSGKPRHAAVCFEKALEASPRYYPKAADNLALAQRAVNQQPSATNAVPTSCP